MSRKFLIPLLTAIFLAAPTFTPVSTLGLSDSALAQKTPATNATNLNSSRSNIYRAKVTRVDDSAKTFTAIADGKEFTFTLPKQGDVPKVGKILDIVYTGQPSGGPLVAIAVSYAGSPADKSTTK